MTSNVLRLSLIMLTIAFFATGIGTSSVWAMWPFDQMFPSQSPPPNNQSNSSSQSSGSPTSQPPY